MKTENFNEAATATAWGMQGKGGEQFPLQQVAATATYSILSLSLSASPSRSLSLFFIRFRSFLFSFLSLLKCFLFQWNESVAMSARHPPVHPLSLPSPAHT